MSKSSESLTRFSNKVLESLPPRVALVFLVSVLLSTWTKPVTAKCDQYKTPSGGMGCNDGFYCTGTGSGGNNPNGWAWNGVCATCPAGHHCPARSYGYLWSSNPVKAIPCDPGKYSNLAGQSACQTCESGKRSDLSSGSIVCLTCHKGTYASIGSSICTECPTGQSTSSMGATSASECLSCPSGKFASPGNGCIACDTGRYSSQVGMTECSVCPYGYISSGTACLLRYKRCEIFNTTDFSGLYQLRNGVFSSAAGAKARVFSYNETLLDQARSQLTCGSTLSLKKVGDYTASPANNYAQTVYSDPFVVTSWWDYGMNLKEFRRDGATFEYKDGWGAGGYFGYALAVSDNGLHLIVGAVHGPKAYIYSKLDVSSPWVNSNSQRTVLSGGSRFGNSVAIDDMYAVVGSGWWTTAAHGSRTIYIFKRISSLLWSTSYVRKVTNPDWTFSGSVAICDYHAVTRTTNKEVYIFTREVGKESAEDSGWPADVTKKYSKPSFAEFGGSYSISANYAVISAQETGGERQIYLYSYSTEGGWNDGPLDVLDGFAGKHYISRQSDLILSTKNGGMKIYTLGCSSDAHCDDVGSFCSEKGVCACRRGYYGHLIGECHQCPPGHTTEGTNARTISECAVCDNGYVPRSSTDSTCVPCLLDTFKESVGSGSCTACSASELQNEDATGCILDSIALISKEEILVPLSLDDRTKSAHTDIRYSSVDFTDEFVIIGKMEENSVAVVSRGNQDDYTIIKKKDESQFGRIVRLSEHYAAVATSTKNVYVYSRLATAWSPSPLALLTPGATPLSLEMTNYDIICCMNGQGARVYSRTRASWSTASVLLAGKTINPGRQCGITKNYAITGSSIFQRGSDGMWDTTPLALSVPSSNRVGIGCQITDNFAVVSSDGNKAHIFARNADGWDATAPQKYLQGNDNGNTEMLLISENFLVLNGLRGILVSNRSHDRKYGESIEFPSSRPLALNKQEIIARASDDVKDKLVIYAYETTSPTSSPTASPSAPTQVPTSSPTTPTVVPTSAPTGFNGQRLGSACRVASECGGSYRACMSPRCVCNPGYYANMYGECRQVPEGHVPTADSSGHTTHFLQEEISASAVWLDFVSSPNMTTLYAIRKDESSVYESNDSGLSWDTSYARRGSNVSWAALQVLSNGTLFALDTNCTLATYGSINSTERSWTTRSLLLSDSKEGECASFVVSYDGTKIALPKKNGLIWLSLDFGETWRIRGSREAWKGIIATPTFDKFAAICSTKSKIYYSHDAGESWHESVDAPESIWTGLVTSPDGGNVVSTALNGIIYLSKDFGLHWEEMTTPSAGCHGIALSPYMAKLTASCQYGIFTSADAGRTWTKSIYPPSYGEGATSTRLLVASEDLEKVAVLAHNKPLLLSFNSAQYFTKSKDGIYTAGEPTRIGAIGYVPCPGGTFAGAGSTSCSSCDAGTYSVSAAGSCTLCDAGTSSAKIEAPSSAFCVSCKPGQYSAHGASACSVCARGRYSPMSTAPLGKLCTPSQAVAGGKVEHICCFPCEAGKFLDTEGSSSSSACKPCTTGYFSSEGSSECLESPAGSFISSSSGIPQPCPAGSFSLPGVTTCTICPRSTYSEGRGSAACTSCVPGRITPTEGAASEEECVSPEGNFLTAAIVLTFVIFLSWEYVFRGRFTVIAFLRRERVSRTLEEHALSVTSYLFRYLYKGEAQRIYNVNRRFLRVFLFGFLGTGLTCLFILGAYLAAMGRIVFKAMIIFFGLKVELPFLSNLQALARILSNVLGMQWLYVVVFAPFVAVITFLAKFEISLDAINLTCAGSTAPMKLLVNLFVMGTVIIVIESEFAVLKGVTFNSLIDKFREVTLNVAYRTWSPSHFESSRVENRQKREMSFWSAYCGGTISRTARYFSFHYIWVVLSSVFVTLLNSADLFQNILQFLTSKVALADFVSVGYIMHSWDDNCNVVKGFYHFDTGIAIAASVVAWLLLFPAMYEVSSILIPGLPKGVSPIADAEQRSLGALKWNQWYRTVWKYTSIFALDLWWAELTYQWVKFVGINTPYDTGDRAPSIAQVESLVIDPAPTHGGDESGENEGFRNLGGSIKSPIVAKDQGDHSDNDDIEVGTDIVPSKTGSQQHQLAALRLNPSATAVLALLEHPDRRLFRAVVCTDPGMRKTRLRFFVCDRVVNRTRVWQEIPVKAPQLKAEDSDCEGGSDSGTYALFLINKTTGDVVFHKSYPMWSFENPESAAEIAHDLLICDDNTAVVFVKWGLRTSDRGMATALAEKSLLQMMKPEDFLDEALPLLLPSSSSLSSSHEDCVKNTHQRHSISKAQRKVSMKRKSSMSLESNSGGLSFASSDHKKEYLDLLHTRGSVRETRLLKDMAEAIAWSGGDAGKLPSATSYILLGTPLKAYYERKIRLRQESVSYQQWSTEHALIFERNLGEDHDVTPEEDVELGPLKLLDLVFTTPVVGADEDGRMQVVPSSSRGSKSWLCFSKRSFIASTLRPRSDGEKAVWRARKGLGLPSYLQLCKLEYEEIKSGDGSWLRSCCAYIPRCLQIFLVIIGLGHFCTSIGRRAWYVVIWKYLRFIGLCFGYWTDDVVEMYEIHAKMRKYSLVWSHPHFKMAKGNSGAGADGEEEMRSQAAEKEKDSGSDSDVCGRNLWLNMVHHHEESKDMSRLPEVTLKAMYMEEYCAVLSTIISTRSTILQVIPGLSVLAIFANLTSIAPLLVRSKELELNLPEIVCSAAHNMAREMESEFTSAVNGIRNSELAEDDYCVDIPDYLSGTHETDHVARRSLKNIEEHNERSRQRMRSCLSQPPLLVKQWAVVLRGRMLSLTHSRGVIFINELCSFLLIIVLLFGPKTEGAYKALVVTSLVLLLPMCIVKALVCYIILGKVLAITDDDITHFHRTIRDSLGCPSAPSAKSSGENKNTESEDHYQNHKEVGELEMTENPLRVSMSSEPKSI